MDLGPLFQQISGLLNHQTGQNDSVDTDGLIGQVANLFRGHAAQSGATFSEPNDQTNNQQYNQGQYGNVLPASQDPLGDPADQQAGILPASQDPLGDPADQR